MLDMILKTCYYDRHNIKDTKESNHMSDADELAMQARVQLAELLEVDYCEIVAMTQYRLEGEKGTTGKDGLRQILSIGESDYLALAKDKTGFDIAIPLWIDDKEKQDKIRRALRNKRYREARKKERQKAEAERIERETTDTINMTDMERYIQQETQAAIGSLTPSEMKRIKESIKTNRVDDKTTVTVFKTTLLTFTHPDPSSLDFDLHVRLNYKTPEGKRLLDKALHAFKRRSASIDTMLASKFTESKLRSYFEEIEDLAGCDTREHARVNERSNSKAYSIDGVRLFTVTTKNDETTVKKYYLQPAEQRKIKDAHEGLTSPK